MKCDVLKGISCSTLWKWETVSRYYNGVKRGTQRCTAVLTWTSRTASVTDDKLWRFEQITSLSNSCLSHRKEKRKAAHYNLYTVPQTHFLELMHIQAAEIQPPPSRHLLYFRTWVGSLLKLAASIVFLPVIIQRIKTIFD